MYIHQLIVKCCYSMECLRKVWSCMRRSLHPRRYCVICRFCQNSFCHFYQPPYSPEEKFLWIWARRVRESGWSSGKACCWRSWRNWWRCWWGCRCCSWCSRVGDLRVWVAWFYFLRNCPKDWRDRLCLSVFLSPLDLRNVNFQTFIPH